MNMLKSLVAEAVGLFVDDGSLAALCVVLIGAVAILVLFVGLPALGGGILLLVGCVVILAWSVWRATR